MGNRDTIASSPIVILLDKARFVKITLQSLLLLEDMYGTVEKAFVAFQSIDNAEKLVLVMTDFLYATTGGGLIKREIENYLTAPRIIEAYEKIKEAVKNDLPETSGTSTEGKHNDETYDWDSLYYIGRYRLNMTDDEFWSSTPKRFWKLKHLYEKAHGLSDEPEEMNLDEIPW